MTEPPPVSPDALTEKELEILRLLAGGHTVKSIAAGLGRSEASINERLREARRKTGVGSSRELARLLAAEKIWDRKIDLSGAGSRLEDEAVPPNRRGRLSQGEMMMLIALPLAAARLILAATTAPAPAAAPGAETALAPSPLAGRWALDVARIPAEERPRAVTMVFRQLSDARWGIVVTVVASDGTAMEAQSTAALDGVAMPVTGSMHGIDSVSLRQPKPDTLVMTLGKDGQRVSTRVYTVAADGKHMTETIVWAAEGMPPMVTTAFNRIG